MNLLKKHIDTVVVLGGILTSVLWMNGKFNQMEIRLVKIETILFLKGIMPADLITKNDQKENETMEGS